MAKKMKDQAPAPEVPNQAIPVTLTEELKARALESVTRFVRDVENDRTYMENKWLVVDRLWRGEPISRWYPGDKTTHIPEPFKQERSVSPRVEMAIFPNEDWFRPIPKRPGSGDPENIRALMQEQLGHGEFELRRKQFIQNCAKYGTAFAKTPWVTDRRNVTMNEPKQKIIYENGEPVDLKDAGKVEKTFEINRDRSEFRNLSIFDFFCDRRYESIYDAPGCADESSQTYEDCLQKIRQGLYTGITETELAEMVQGPAQTNLSSGREMQLQANGAGLQKPEPKNAIRTLDFWGLFDLGGKGERVECEVVILNRQKVVRVVRNNLWHGYRPYLFAKWTPVEGELYGIGVIEPIVHLCMDINDMQNSINAAAYLGVNPMYKVGDGMNIIDEQIIAAPGRVFRGEDIAQMQVLHTPDTTQIARLNKEELRNEVSETNMSPRLFMGQMESGQESATGFAGRMREGNLNVKAISEGMAKTCFSRFLEMMAYNNQQFIQEERVVHLTGDAGAYKQFKVTPSDLAGVARVEIIMAPQIELLGVRGQQMMAFLQALSTNPALLAGINPAKLVKTVFVNEFGYKDVKDIFPPAPEDHMLPQREENLLMARNLVIDVHAWHNHAEHAKECWNYMQTDHFQRLDAERQAIFEAHLATHEMFMRQNQEMQQQMAPPQLSGPEMGGGEMPQGPGGPAPMAPAPTPGIASGRELAVARRGALQGG